jgi:hypothetical protein
MPTYDLELFRRLEQAAQIAAAISSGLLGQVMEAQRHEIHCRGVLGAAEMRLRAYQHGDQPLSDEDAQAWGPRIAELERAREAERDRLRRHARGMPPGAAQHAAEQLSALQKPPRENFLAAVEAATARLAAPEREVAVLIDQQGRPGARAGRLRQTCDEARAFLEQHCPGLLTEIIRQPATGCTGGRPCDRIERRTRFGSGRSSVQHLANALNHVLVTCDR